MEKKKYPKPNPPPPVRFGYDEPPLITWIFIGLLGLLLFAGLLVILFAHP